MSSFPAIFISHGSPDMPLHPSPTRSFLQQLGTTLGKPKAILAVSAHWATAVPTVSLADKAKTIHDFWGFPPAVYQLNYPAPGAPDLAKQTATVLAQSGFEVATQADRGLDHGAWEPLLLMYPDADIPVTQLSLQPHLGAEHHLKLGRALAALRHDSVLIVASGGATHNLRAFGQYGEHEAPPEWVKSFDDWVAEAIAMHQVDALVHYRQQAPFATQNHPSEEHFLPLLVALGAGSSDIPGTQIHAGYSYGILSMAAYQFA